jgi:DNA-binding NarL/FixJ family response regulator
MDVVSPCVVAECRTADPGVILLDLGDGVGTDLLFVSTLVDEFPQIGIVVLGDLDSGRVADLFAMGVRGCLTYSASVADVGRAIDSLLAGQTVMPSAVVTKLLSGAGRPSTSAKGSPALSLRECEVLGRVCAGCATTAIADELGISIPTVRKHVQNILDKLGLHSRLEAAAYASRHGIA